MCPLRAGGSPGEPVFSQPAGPRRQDQPPTWETLCGDCKVPAQELLCRQDASRSGTDHEPGLYGGPQGPPHGFTFQTYSVI